MSVNVRPYVVATNHAEGCTRRRCGSDCKRVTEGWEVDIVLTLPDGTLHRERKKSPVSSKSGSKAWGEQRANELVKNGRQVREEKPPTFEEFFPRYIVGYSEANREKPSSIDSKRRLWKNYLQPRYSRTRLNELATEDVQRLKGELTHLAPKTVNNVLSLLNGMLKTAHEWRVIRELPLKVRMLKPKSRDVHFYEPDEYERLVEAARRISPPVHAMVLLGGDAGLRSGEIIGLRWQDIDFKKGALHVRRAVWMGEVTLPKSGKERTVPMTSRLAECLRGQRHLVRDEVLYRPGGEQASRATVHKWLKQAERRAGLESVGALHKLRHTFCSRLARNGAAAAAIQQLAGHSSYATTSRYVHLFVGAKESAIKLLEPQAAVGDILETGLSKPS